MKSLFNGNEIPTDDLQVELPKIIPQQSVLRDIALPKEEDGKEPFVRYTLLNPTNFDTFKVKVPGNTPIITKEQLAESTENIIVELPISQLKAKVYAISYGKAKVSITAPAIRIKKGEKV